MRHCGLIVSALNSGSIGLSSSPGRGRCVVFLGKALYLTVPLSAQVYKWVPANVMLGVILRLTSNPGGSRNAPILFMLQKSG